MTQGIGAQDGDPITLTATPFVKDINPYEFTMTAGELHSDNREWANIWRRRAFDRIPSYATLEPAGNHTFGATEAELRLGVPAWPR